MVTTPNEPVGDDDIETVGGGSGTGESTQDADGTDAGDGDSTDTSDGDSTDSTDGNDADGTDA